MALKTASTDWGYAKKSTSVSHHICVQVIKTCPGIEVRQDRVPINEVGRSRNNVTSPSGAREMEVKGTISRLAGVQCHYVRSQGGCDGDRPLRYGQGE